MIYKGKVPSEKYAEVLRRVDQLQGETVSIRRYLHQYPETSIHTPETEIYIRKFLAENGIPVLETEIGVMGLIRGENHEKVLGLRADIDGLPMTEKSQASYCSKREGIMHACGHDGHTAMLMTAAKVLQEYRHLLPYDVAVIFQPGEEGPGSGAKIMAEQLKRTELGRRLDHLCAFHLTNELETGKIGLKYGSAMASTDDINLRIQGIGGHGGLPHLTVDPISVGAKVINQIESYITKRVNAADSLVISIGIFQAGQWRAMIPEEAKMEGTMRCLSEETRKQAREEIVRLVKGICLACGAEYELEIKEDVPVLVTDERVMRKNAAIFAQILGVENIVLQREAKMTAEDFSYFSQIWPVSFMWLGCGNKEKGFTAQLHNPSFDFDEDVLSLGAKLHCLSAIGINE